MTRLTLVFAPRQDSPPLGGQVQTVARDRPDPPSVGDYHCCSLDSAVPVVDGAPSPPPPLLGCSGGEFCGAKSPSRSKAQGGWGGSAHYPDPTAQSARSRPPGDRRRTTHRADALERATVLLATVLWATVLSATVCWATVLWAVLVGGGAVVGGGSCSARGGRASLPCARLSRARSQFPCRWLGIDKSTHSCTPQVKHPVVMTQRGPTCLRMSSLTAMTPCSR